MHYYILLGSNIGNSKAYIEKAKFLLGSILCIDKQSSLYKTAPWGETNQDYFLNQVLQLSSDIEPRELMSRIEGLESLLGKQKTSKYGPRTIDIDILLYGDNIISENNLYVPHPRMHKRAFTLIPLNEIAPDVYHPQLNKTIKELLAECQDDSEVIKII